MSDDISLKIFTPEKTALNKKVHRVVLPMKKTNLTLIAERAPTSLLLVEGVLQILDENDDIAASYFIDGGIADAAENICKISTPKFLAVSAISKEKALELKQKEPQNAAFYEMIAHYFDTLPH